MRAMAKRKGRTRRSVDDGHGFVRSVRLMREGVASFDVYPFSIPAVRGLDELALSRGVTFLVGENGSGKSTLLEAIAVLLGFNAEGGSKNFSFSTRPSESELPRHMRAVRGSRRERDGFFMRAESFFNAASYIEDVGVLESYGGRSLHEQSHGESFLALARHRFRGEGLYLLDEPEAALSPARQLTLLAIMRDLVAGGSQLVIATHSPILLAFPGATIYELGAAGIRPVAYEQTEHYQITRDFLVSRERYFKHLFADSEPPGSEPPDDE
jgi:predicted ATPase